MTTSNDEVNDAMTAHSSEDYIAISSEEEGEVELSPNSVEYKIGNIVACVHPLAVFIGKRALTVFTAICCVLLMLASIPSISPVQFVFSFFILLVLYRHKVKQQRKFSVVSNSTFFVRCRSKSWRFLLVESRFRLFNH
jgi:hypothetical protein